MIKQIDRNLLFKVGLLTIIWLILREGFSFADLFIGLAISICCVAYSRKFLPLKGFQNVKFYQLIIYVFYLLGQIYLAGFYVIKLIVKGNARTLILQTYTRLENETLKVLLGDSITLTPGSVMLDMTDDLITVLVLIDKDEKINSGDVDKLIKGGLEAQLTKAQL